ncbi:50S ribosomal protein L10 [Candidatus Falkowbacteria bacterium]|nr:50S ribosomal protein L10 [Candidatus Falkowbacteria bacterium]
MPKTKQQKKEIVDSLKDKLSRSKSVIFTKFEGLGVAENESLRKDLRDSSSEYCVAKKTLMDIAFKDFEGLSPKDFEGKVAAIFGYEDEVAPAKVVSDFKKELSDEEKDKIVFVGGLLENKFISKEEVDNLSKLPSREELYAKVVGSLNSPISGFVNALAGNLRNLVYVLKAIEEKKA